MVLRAFMYSMKGVLMVSGITLVLGRNLSESGLGVFSVWMKIVRRCCWGANGLRTLHDCWLTRGRTVERRALAVCACLLLLALAEAEAEADATWRRRGMVVVAAGLVVLETKGTRPCRSNSLFEGIVGGLVLLCRGKDTATTSDDEEGRRRWERKGMTPKQEIPTHLPAIPKCCRRAGAWNCQRPLTLTRFSAGMRPLPCHVYGPSVMHGGRSVLLRHTKLFAIFGAIDWGFLVSLTGKFVSLYSNWVELEIPSWH